MYWSFRILGHQGHQTAYFRLLPDFSIFSGLMLVRAFVIVSHYILVHLLRLIRDISKFCMHMDVKLCRFHHEVNLGCWWWYLDIFKFDITRINTACIATLFTIHYYINPSIHPSNPWHEWSSFVHYKYSSTRFSSTKIFDVVFSTFAIALYEATPQCPH